MTEEAVSFRHDGDLLFGILHAPEGAAPPALGFVFPHSGSRGRLGNTFHYRFFARELARRGYPVLRFDPPGLGDSEGVIETAFTQDFYGSIQHGRYVGDTLAAVAELRRRAHPKRIVLLGVCGGAFTALASAAASGTVDGAVLLSLPVMLDSSRTEQVKRIPAEHARKRLAIYRDKLLSPKAWWRFITSQSDTQAIKTYVRALLPSLIASRFQKPTATDDGAAKLTANPLFFEAARTLARRARRVLLIYGREDHFYSEFEREFLDVHWAREPAYAAVWELQVPSTAITCSRCANGRSEPCSASSTGCRT